MVIFSAVPNRNGCKTPQEFKEALMKTIAGWISILLLSTIIFLSGCRTIKQDTPLDKDALRVGISSTYPPIIFRQGKQVAGVEADLARDLAKALGRKLIWVELKRDQLIPSLIEGKIDIIMSGMSVTDLRMMRITFADPYIETGQMALMRHSSAARYDSPESIMESSARIGVQDGTTGDVFVQTRCQHASKVRLDKPEDAMFYFKGNRIDMFIYDAPTIMLMASQHEAEVVPLWRLLTNENLAWGVRRQDSDLLTAINSLLAEWRQNGELAKILDRWMPQSKRLQK